MTGEPQVVARRVRGVEVVHVTGDVDVSNAADVGGRIAAHVRTGTALVVDLTTVPFMDSAGVRMLDDVAGAAQDRQAPLRIVAPDRGPVRLVLRITAFPEGLLEPTVAEAVAALA